MNGVKRMARLTGLAYLGLAISGLLGFLLIHEQLYVAGDATRTAANLIAHEGLARVGIAVDVAVVLTQALAAVGFWLLFRSIHPVAAGSIAAFGLVNSVTILVGTMFSATALDVALRAGTGSATDTLILYDLHGAAIQLGGVFYGLWLIPMGWLACRSRYLPRSLGWLLVVGGVGYLLNVVVVALAPGASDAASALVLPATAGELWMVGYLLAKGVSDRAFADGRPAPDPEFALT